MKNIFTSLSLCALAVPILLLGGGCSDDDTEPAVGSKGGSKTVYISSQAGMRTVRVDANGPWQARLTPDTRSWAAFDGPDHGEQDGSFTVRYRTNNGLNRRGTVLVSSGSRQVIDTIYLNQYGETPLLRFYHPSRLYSSVGALDSVALDTNIPQSQTIYYSIQYDRKDADWIDSINYGDRAYFRFRIADNTAFESRQARIRLRYQDAFGDDYVAYCDIAQGIPGGTPQTREVTFEELRAMIAQAEGEIVIDDDIALSGVVVSDRTSPNTAGCPMTRAATKPDLTLNARTAYMQNADASLGIALVTDQAEQNNLNRYDKLKLWCKGLRLTKRSDPERYTLSGVTQDHIVTKSAGTADELPVKRRFIDQLTDADLYTFVTLKRCQMAVRTGRFAPVHVNYLRDYNTYYPTPVIDRHGDMIPLMTNNGCAWKYDEMPDGEGTVSGVIVHERCTFFDRSGDIGRYQIRNVTREDIALDASYDNGFSAVAVEWCPDGSNAGSGNVREYAFPQYPHPANAEGKAHCVLASTGSGLSFMDTYAWLAWGSSYRAAVDGGAPGNTAWGHATLWDKSANTGHALLFEFSTRGLSSNQCCFVFYGRNYSGQGGMRYWTAEWSVDGETWNPLIDYTMPDQGNWGAMQLEQLSGDKTVWMKVPVEILGRDVAWIRLRAAQDKIGTATTYDTDVTTAAGAAKTAFVVSYAALRYNK